MYEMNGDQNDEKILEKHLLKLLECFDLDAPKTLHSGNVLSNEEAVDCNIQLDIGESMSWIVKFRRTGVIVNNRDCISSSFLEIDSIISFKTICDFFGATSPSGGCESIDTDSEYQFIYSGNEVTLEYFWGKLLLIGVSSNLRSYYDERIAGGGLGVCGGVGGGGGLGGAGGGVGGGVKVISPRPPVSGGRLMLNNGNGSNGIYGNVGNSGSNSSSGNNGSSGSMGGNGYSNNGINSGSSSSGSNIAGGAGSAGGSMPSSSSNSNLQHMQIHNTNNSNNINHVNGVNNNSSNSSSSSNGYNSDTPYGNSDNSKHADNGHTTPSSAVVNQSTAARGQTQGQDPDPSLRIVMCGSLLKKNDILAGWQSRYFVLQKNRLSYFRDENSFRKGANTRGTILLSGAEVSSAKACMVNGGEHYAITVEPKSRGKCIRVCSEQSGPPGKEEMLVWEQEFVKASMSLAALSITENHGLPEWKNNFVKNINSFQFRANNLLQLPISNQNGINMIKGTMKNANNDYRKIRNGYTQGDRGNSENAENSDVNQNNGNNGNNGNRTINLINNGKIKNNYTDESSILGNRRMSLKGDKEENTQTKQFTGVLSILNSLNGFIGNSGDFKHSNGFGLFNGLLDMLLEGVENADRTSVLFISSGVLCLLAGYVMRGVLGGCMSGLLIWFIYRVIPERD